MITYFDSQLWDDTLPSRKYIQDLNQKKILLINVGLGQRKYNIMKRVRDLGVGHIVVLNSDDAWFQPLVDATIVGDSATPLADAHKPKSDKRIKDILAYMKKHDIEFDGVWTFTDTSVVLCAQIADFLGKPGIRADDIVQLKNKQILREWLYEHREALGVDSPHVYPLPRIEPDRVDSADFPIIVKGVESVGKSLIHIAENPAQLETYLGKYSSDTITLEPYFEGTDIDLNVLVQDGRIQWFGFIENLTAIQPGFLEDGSIAHHSITKEEQKEIVAYMQRILDVSGGIKSACLHVEFRLRREEESFSFTLIEINFRMGGVENFSFHLGYDDYDIIQSNIELALGMPLSQTFKPYQHKGKYKYMMNRNIYSHMSGILTGVTPPNATKNLIEYVFHAPDDMNCNFPPGPNDEFGWIVAGSRKSAEDLQNALDSLSDETQPNIVSDIV